ncbi:tyrosine-protein kinase SRK3 [Electrophorus electricus]|uniref:tyrosine-protein kinase SRK3 n=1 Tax=Electrophorus electricus TaxID=8005 RepID=UPI000F09DB97|nr:tyrosine-protein kinase SRK3 [Electrophorus electricus]
MGNCTCYCKSCPLLCSEQEDEETAKTNRAYKSLYNYQCHTLMDLKLSRGDILEVIEETQHWLYVKKHTVKDKNGIVKEEGYVPRNYVKPVTSLEANLWYFENIKTRIEAKRCLLRPENSEGAFLVWRSSKNHHFYLSVKNEPHARHYRIKEQETDQRFYLVIQKTFKTLSELVQSYSKHQDGLCTRLSHPCVMLDVPTLPSLSVDAQWEVDRSLLTKVKKLGSGEFAEVWQGVWDKKIDVAIKELRAVSPEIHTEIKIMKELHHERLLKLYAVCTISEPFCIITELMKNGSLKKYLINHKEKKDIEYSLMIDFAVQIAEGMAYLESKNIVHRDLRADNILLTDMQSCKIADFGLAQFTFQMDQNISSVKVPVKWMAPEIFDGREYTTKCDVWSFGVLLTEIITYGNNPYPDQDKTACIQAIQRGERMKRPLDCPLALYDIMLLCWIFNPQERPCFTELQDRLMALVPEPVLELE